MNGGLRETVERIDDRKKERKIEDEWKERAREENNR